MLLSQDEDNIFSDFWGLLKLPQRRRVYFKRISSDRQQNMPIGLLDGSDLSFPAYSAILKLLYSLQIKKIANISSENEKNLFFELHLYFIDV